MGRGARAQTDVAARIGIAMQLRLPWCRNTNQLCASALMTTQHVFSTLAVVSCAVDIAHIDALFGVHTRPSTIRLD